ncbi:acetyl-CoA carboxylase, biotin carboxyl carrier protein [Proteobacteria bacterium 005FR1]|nr:acetyl-CoA carboxylase, biotin carboxyl carrier protein [Proteobacteria bacterium 005FR1]
MTKVTSEDIKSIIEIFDESEWRDLSLQVEDFRIFLSRDPQADWGAWPGATAPGSMRGKDSSASAAAPIAAAPAADAAVPAPAPARSAQAPGHEESSSPGASKDSSPAPENAVAVCAPNLGIFYRSPKPGAAPYVQLGDEIEPGTEICLIEVMKLFTPVTAEVKGKICKICVEDGELVEHNQPLFYIEPAE